MEIEPQPQIFDADESNFEELIIRGSEERVIVIDFWAPWCGPCRAIAPHVEALGDQYTGKLKVAKVNVDKNQQVAGQFGIRGIPAILVFKNGEIANQLTGMPANPKGKLQELVESVL